MNSTTATYPASTTPQLTIDNGRATIRLARPAEHNRLEPADLDALVEMFAKVAADPACRVLVITGTGKSFSSGFHIGALVERKTSDEPVAEHNPNAFEEMVDALENLPIPTIAALNGGVYGGSTDLALACDFRIGVEGMQMFMPAARLGIVYYASGLHRYVSRLGLNHAKKLFMTAEHTKAADLLAMGYLTELVPAGELDARVDALVEKLAGCAPLALAGLKRALNDIAAGNFDPAAHAAAKELCSESEDHKEGLMAWKEKRPPVFSGR